MVEIYMVLDGTPPAQKVILDLITSAYGDPLDAGEDETGASLWLINTGYETRAARAALAPPNSGTVHARLTLQYGISSDPDRVHELVHCRMACGAAEEISAGIAFIAEPEHPPT